MKEPEILPSNPSSSSTHTLNVSTPLSVPLKARPPEPAVDTSSEAFSSLQKELGLLKRENKELKCEVHLLKGSLEEQQSIGSEEEVVLRSKLRSATETIDSLRKELLGSHKVCSFSIED